MASMKTNSIPLTINLHTLTSCNYRCGFCYAGFGSSNRAQMSQSELHEIIRQIGGLPCPPGRKARKVTFAGGEPLLSSTLVADIALARGEGLVTSLVTNGSLLTTEKIQQLAPVLDWLTISVDSLVPETNRRIGRAVRGSSPTVQDYFTAIQNAQSLGIRTKVNTVVNRANASEDFHKFIRATRPLRWKLIQATRIEGENGADFDRWAIDDATFHRFVARHADLSNEGVTLVPETQLEVYGSYAMVGPNGCFFDNSEGTYRYSRPIISVGIEAAWSEITFSPERFRARLGDYDFATGFHREEILN